MDARMIVTLVVFLFMIVSFSLHKFPMALTAILGMLALVVTGCVEPKTALSNIGSSTVITGNRSYLGPKHTYEYGAYEAVGGSSNYVQGTAEAMAEKWVELLTKLV